MAAYIINFLYLLVNVIFTCILTDSNCILFHHREQEAVNLSAQERDDFFISSSFKLELPFCYLFFLLKINSVGCPKLQISGENRTSPALAVHWTVFLCIKLRLRHGFNMYENKCCRESLYLVNLFKILLNDITSFCFLHMWICAWDVFPSSTFSKGPLIKH